MRPAEQKITRFLSTRWCAMLFMALALASAFAAMPEVILKPLAEIDRGLLFSSPGHWITNPVKSGWWSIGINVAIMLLMALINRRYNLIRTMTWLVVGMFAVMEAATPETLRVFNGGQFAAIVILWCIWLMFSSYHRRRRTKKVFMAFCLLSGAVMVQYGFIIYLGVFLAGCAQMRVFRVKPLVAAMLGVVTPWWIVFGLGLASFSDLHLPVIRNPFTTIGSLESIQLFLPVGLVLLTGLFCGSLNLIKVLAMNARMRALNGLMSLTSIVTGIMAIIDFTNIEFYIPLLNAGVAFQIGHFFRINAHRRGYILILLLIIAYTGLWIWKLLV